MNSYLLTKDAEWDIDTIKSYLLEQGGPPLVQHVLGEIETSLELLGGMPGAGHSRRDLTSDRMRFWRVFSYFIIYDPAPRPIHIIRILHSRRDLEALLNS